MKHIWSPWRLEYIKGKKEKGCIFCNRVRRKNDKKDFIIYRGKNNFVVMNRYPYNSGHLMIVPNRHTNKLESLKTHEFQEMMQLIQKTIQVLKRSAHPDGFNIGMNLGRYAGAGIVGHLHMHVVPRWRADTNFFPVVTDTRAVPQAIEETMKTIKKFWRRDL